MRERYQLACPTCGRRVQHENDLGAHQRQRHGRTRMTHQAQERARRRALSANRND